MTNNKIRIQDFLSRIPLFQGLSDDDLDGLATTTTQIHAPRGTVLFKQGDPCLGFHTVMYGQVKLMLSTPVGDEKVVRLIQPGGSFGEALMFMDKAYIVSAQTLEDTLLIHVGKDALFTKMERHPRLARMMIATLSQRLHGLMSDVEAYSLRSGSQRVIGYLLKNDGDEPVQQLRLSTSKAVIASRLNLTPEHFSRILRELSDQNLIEVKGRDITILDLKRLRSYDG